MDAGCLVSWEHCFDRDTELSAIQHAYNALIDDGEEVFASECQNEPLDLYGGLDALTAQLVAKEWRRSDGAIFRLEKQLIDANWGPSTDVVYRFCQQSPHAAVLMPSHGRYVGATSRAFNDVQRKLGERSGLNWRIPHLGGKRSTRYALFDANAWKTFARSRWATPMGGRGALTLFGSDPLAHAMFAAHQVAEYAITVEAKGRQVVEWKLKPSRPDNHLLDGVVGCCVAASIQGANLAETSAAQVKRARQKLSDIQKAKQQQQR
jgi:hypothetical protein